MPSIRGGSIILILQKTGYLSSIRQPDKGRVSWLVFIVMDPHKSDYHGLIIRFERR